MKNSRLVIVAGMSGVGKSSISQNLAKQYALNKIKHKWLHEEIKDHPIREGEFNIGNIYEETDMDLNVLDMYKRWSKLVEEIQKSDEVYIMEGCLYQNIIRYFFSCNYPIEKITLFYDNLMKILEPLNPTIVYLYRKNIKASFEEAFKVRGERWKNIILEPEYEGYFFKHEYTGDESIYKKWQHYQEISNAMFERYKGYKIKFETSEQLWKKYMIELTNYLGLEYKEAKNILLQNKEKYCGKYAVDVDGNQRVIEIKLVDDNLYCQVFFWDNMKLIPLENDEFEVLSFPIKLCFHYLDNKKVIKVMGTYDWSLSGKTLIEV